jgi:tetratricopeptide (TPR) repeat protein
MRRHAFGVAVTATFVAVILAFAIVMSVQRERVAEERDAAESVSEFMVRVFDNSDPYNNEGKPQTAVQLLDQARDKITGGLLRDKLLVRVRLLQAIGRSYRRQGDPGRALPLLAEARRIRQEQNLPDTGSLLTELALALRDSGDLVQSDALFQQAKVVSLSNANEKSSTRALMLVDLGRLEQQRSHLPAAEEYFQSALAMTIQVEGENSSEVASILSQLSSLRAWQDDLDGAEDTARKAIAIYAVSGLKETHPDRIMADGRLAEVLFLKGVVNTAGELYEGVLSRQQKLYGESSKPVADTLDALARVRLAQNKPAEAEKLTREAVAILERFSEDGKPNFMTGYLRTSLAQILLRQEKYAEAETEILKARAIYEVTLDPDHQYIASAEYVQGEILLGLHQYADAEGVLTASMNRWKRTPAPAWRSARSASALGEALYRENKLRDAEKYLLQGFLDLNTADGVDPVSVRKARERIERFYTDRGERQKLDALNVGVSHADAASTKGARPN